MKKIILSIVFILTLFLTQNVFADNNTQLHTVRLTNDPSSESVHKTDANLGDYFVIPVKVKITGNFDLYMILTKESETGNGASEEFTLCHKTNVTPGNVNMEFNPTGANRCENQMAIQRGFFEPGYIYNVFISDEDKGINITVDSGGNYVMSPLPEIPASQSQNGAGSTNQNTANNTNNSNNNQNSNQTSNQTNPSNSYNSGHGLVHSDCGYSSSGAGNFRICGFNDFLSLINRVIDFIFSLVLPIAAIVFVYVGFLFLSSAAKPDKRTAAKAAMGKLILGIVIIMLAWILIKTVLVTLGVPAGFTFLDIRN